MKKLLFLLKKIDFKKLETKVKLELNERVELGVLSALLIAAIVGYGALEVFIALLFLFVRYFVSILHHNEVIIYKGNLASLFDFEIVESTKEKSGKDKNK